MNHKSFPYRFFTPLIAALLLFAALVPDHLSAQVNYFPPAGGEWERRKPEQVKIDSAKLKEAIDFAVASEAKAPRDMELSQTQSFGREPFGAIIGATKPRGAMTGMILRNGYLVAEWGDPDRVDMSHSVTKSFLSTVVGLAFDRGLIKDLSAPVYREMAPVLLYTPNRNFADAANFGKSKFIDLFDTEHNRRVTWDSLLRQTSDWEGTLWGKPDWADRPDKDANLWLERKRNAPGAVYEYNDVRVNALALAALNVWRKPLPQVLKENVMDEIGASNTWRWYGYENSFVVIDGQIIESVSGGGHWGGGMFISARDMARFGLSDGKRREMARQADLIRRFYQTSQNPDRRAADLRLYELFSQHRPQVIPVGARVGLRAHRQRHERDLR